MNTIETIIAFYKLIWSIQEKHLHCTLKKPKRACLLNLFPFEPVALYYKKDILFFNDVNVSS